MHHIFLCSLGMVFALVLWPLDASESKDSSPLSSALGGGASDVAIIWDGTCLETAVIPAGTFTQGDQYEMGGSDERPLRLVNLSANYALAVAEITNRQYVEMLNWAIARGYVEVDDPGSPKFVLNVAADPHDGGTAWRQEWLVSLDSNSTQIIWEEGAFRVKDVTGHPDGEFSSRAEHPAVGVSWFGAIFFCWALNERSGGEVQPISLTHWTIDHSGSGWRLPTEAEWERAARGGWDGGAKYPWWTAEPGSQSEPDGTQANGSNDGDIYEGVAGWPYTAPVGSFPMNAYGLSGMAGNVQEWCTDWYDSEAYHEGSPAIDPLGPSAGSHRVVRGGSWSILGSDLRCAGRAGIIPTNMHSHVGFRPVLSGPRRMVHLSIDSREGAQVSLDGGSFLEAPVSLLMDTASDHLIQLRQPINEVERALFDAVSASAAPLTRTGIAILTPVD